MKYWFLGALAGVALYAGPACPQVRDLPSPAGPGSGQPNLTVASDGRVYLSWIERPDDSRSALRFSVMVADGWTAPRDSPWAGPAFGENAATVPHQTVLDHL